MKSVTLSQLGFALALASAIVVCTSCTDGGFLQPPKPSGTIIADVIGGQYLNTSITDPYTPTAGFAVSLTEGDYTPAQFLAMITSFTAPTMGPCYLVTMNTAGNVATFTPQNATAVAGYPFSDPCLIPSSDLEQVRFSDENGHSNVQWFKRVGTSGNAGALSEMYYGPNSVPTPAPPATATPLATSATSAQNVDQNGSLPSSFSIQVLSTISAGPFKAASIYWTAATSLSCLTISPTSSTNGLFTFTLATPLPVSGAGTSPCLTVGSDIEEVLFSDDFGNSNVQFFKL